MLNLISELITAKNRLNGIADSLINENLQLVASQINRTTDDIYAGLMRIRMVKLDRLFNKFHGVVRNLARDEGREVRLVIEGADRRRQLLRHSLNRNGSRRSRRHERDKGDGGIYNRPG